MKKLFIILVTAFCMVACHDYNGPQVDNAEYYVKYSIKSSFYKFGSIYYADVNGTSTDRMGDYSNTSTQWAVTIGPVKKGFYASVQYDRGTADVVKIEVSKNGGPFAQKASGSNSASYRINF